jgi:hypothetical protein
MTLGVLGGISGIMLAAPGAAHAETFPGCDSGYTQYTFTHGLDYGGVAINTAGTTSPHPEHVNGNGQNEYVLCTDTTSACSPACSSGVGYWFDVNEGAYVVASTVTYDNTAVAAATSESTADEWQWACQHNGTTHTFLLQGAASGKVMNFFSSHSSFSDVLADPSTGGTYGDTAPVNTADNSFCS